MRGKWNWIAPLSQDSSVPILQYLFVVTIVIVLVLVMMIGIMVLLGIMGMYSDAFRRADSKNDLLFKF